MRADLGIAAALAALVLGGCQAGVTGSAVPEKGTMLAAIRPDPAPLPAPAESKVVHTFLLAEAGVVASPAVMAYADRVLDRLLAGWPGPRPPLRVYVVPDGVFNSEASADGGIFLTTGTLAYLRNTAEVRTEDHFAFILAHELAHILLGHTRDRARTQEAMHRVSGVLTLGSSIAAGSSVAKVAAAAQWAAAANFGLTATADQALFPSWSRGQEREADVLAVDLVAKAGYAADAGPTVLEVIEQNEARAAVQAEANRPPLVRRTGNGASLQLAPVIVGAWEDIGRSHPTAAVRNADLRGYVEREYGSQVVRKRRTEMERFLAAREVRDLLAEADALEEARGLIAAHDARRALPKLAALGRSPIAGSSAAQFALFRAQLETGQGNSAAAAAAATTGPYATMPAQMFVAHILEAQGNKEDALKLYEAVGTRFEEPGVLPYRIRLLTQLGRKNEATLLRATCYATGQPKLQLDCDAASKG